MYYIYSIFMTVFYNFDPNFHKIKTIFFLLILRKLQTNDYFIYIVVWNRKQNIQSKRTVPNETKISVVIKLEYKLHD